ncbi:MAG TPA: hypothetical protein PK325_01435 [Cyclobacteriaceae bacterium]|nr:hypothetical protein [Cyclobacteriaceae bacterium]HMV08068.1 hypothetical protein [Cyclobacteriaceae bacterium]HMV88284.1 hypothetical protein [Cyclobacteriaceae bacterium]HMX00708.1 hypothetical protein [Cyclobacteriaceae bacterium]HMX49417.1 hypothetical protein [Cyclobacteriaceae bacterium]
MAKFSAEINLDAFDQKLDAIQKSLARLEQFIPNVSEKAYKALKPIPQKAAIQELGTTFPTFKKLCVEFRVKEIKRNGRIFYKPSDVQRMLDGRK